MPAGPGGVICQRDGSTQSPSGEKASARSARHSALPGAPVLALPASADTHGLPLARSPTRMARQLTKMPGQWGAGPSVLVHALNVWRCYVEGWRPHPCKAETDHQSLTHQHTKSGLPLRQVRWSELPAGAAPCRCRSERACPLVKNMLVRSAKNRCACFSSKRTLLLPPPPPSSQRTTGSLLRTAPLHPQGREGLPEPPQNCTDVQRRGPSMPSRPAKPAPVTAARM